MAIALAHGLAIGLMVIAAGRVWGGHFNPAVTIGMLVTRRTQPDLAVAYIAAQLVGAVLGAGALTLMYLDVDRNRVELGLPVVGNSLTADPPQALTTGNAVAMEAVLTFFLMFVIYGALSITTSGRVDERSPGWRLD